MDNIKQLVENTAKILGEDYNDYDWSEYTERAKRMFRKIAKEILSQEGLYLIGQVPIRTLMKQYPGIISLEESLKGMEFMIKEME